MRPWAANKGIQLIQEAVAKSSHLADEDFQRLIDSVQRCMLHLIGDRNTASRNQSASEASSGNPNGGQFFVHSLYHHHHHYQQQQQQQMKVSHSMSDSMRDQSSGSNNNYNNSGGNVIDSTSLADAHTRYSAQQLSSNSNAESMGSSSAGAPISSSYTRSSSISSQRLHQQQLLQQQQARGSAKDSPRVRFGTNCHEADKRREDVLLQKRYIGKILENKNSTSAHIFDQTEVSFRWQLGLLIG